MQLDRRNMRMSGRGSLTGNFTWRDIRQWRKKSRSEKCRPNTNRNTFPFPVCNKGWVNSLQFKKGGFNLLLSSARFFIFLLKHNEKRAGAHSNSAVCLSELNRPLVGVEFCRVELRLRGSFLWIIQIEKIIYTKIQCGGLNTLVFLVCLLIEV